VECRNRLSDQSLHEGNLGIVSVVVNENLYCQSNAMHGQNINLPVCVCVSVVCVWGVGGAESHGHENDRPEIGGPYCRA